MSSVLPFTPHFLWKDLVWIYDNNGSLSPSALSCQQKFILCMTITMALLLGSHQLQGF